MPRKRPKRDPFVQIHLYEMSTPAWKTLSCEGRSLLVEMRGLYKGAENEVFMSIREVQKRLCVGRKKAERAMNELLERGWIRLKQKGSFHVKTRIASVYSLTNVPLEDRDGAVAPKDYMKWTPPARK